MFDTPHSEELTASLEPKTPVAPCTSAEPLPPEAARRLLSASTRRFLDRTLDWHHSGEDGSTPVLAIRGTMGLGKSRTAYAEIAAAASSLLEHGHVVFYAPTHALAREAEETFRAARPGIPTTVLLGRGAVLGGRTLCARWEALKSLSGMVPSFRSAVCRVRHEDRTVFADCHEGCAYHAQFAFYEPRVIFTSHAYLRSPLPIRGDVALRVIDEAYWPTLHGRGNLLPEAWLDGPVPPCEAEQRESHARLLRQTCGANGRSRSQRDQEELPFVLVRYGFLERIGEARQIVLDALRTGGSPIARLAAVGFEKEHLRGFADWESKDLPSPRIRVDQAPAVQERIIADFDKSQRIAMLLRSRVWTLLADAFELGHTERLSWRSFGICPDTQQERFVIGLHLRKDLPTDAPILMIDGDADPVITRAFAPHSEFQRIDAIQTAEVVQLSDLTLSSRWLLDQASGRLRREHVMAIIREEVAASPGPVLLVATKAVLKAMHKDADPEWTYKGEEDLRAPLCGATPAWFGPAMRGINDYRHFPSMVIVGRLEPPMSAVDDAMRAVFGDRSPAGPSLEKRHPEQRFISRVPYYTPNGPRRLGKISTHPDPRGAALVT